MCLALAHGGCIPNAAVKRGDAAAARGDWRAAEAEYRKAVDRDSDNVQLAQKYAEAKTNAVAFAIRTAEACRTSNDAACVDSELTYVLRLDPSNVQAASLRKEARQEIAVRALEEAKLSLESDNPSGVWRQLAIVRSYGVPVGREEEVAHLDEASAAQADERARVLLERAKTQQTSSAAATLSQARQLAAGAAERSTRYVGTLAEVDEARRRVIAAEVAEQTKLGDEALTREDYEGAASAFASAYRVSGDTRHQSRATYANSMHAAGIAIGQRSFEDAVGHLRTALDTLEDRGAARALLDAAEPRVYRIRLESIVITQTKPGTTEPWVGKRWWTKIAPIGVGVVASWSAGSAAGKVAYDITDSISNIPPENRPGLVTLIDLPDGRRLKTPKVKGIHVIFGAEFYLYTNRFDTRTLRLEVYHERSGGNEGVAVANVPLGEIVTGKIDVAGIQGDAQALRHVVFAVDPAEAWQDGALKGAGVQDQVENRAGARSLPSRAAQRVQLLSATLSIPSEAGDGDGSNPDPYFEIHQNGKQVVKSTKVDNTRATDWSFSSTDLFLDPAENLVVKLTDSDFANDDHISTWTVSAREFLSGQVSLATARGTSLSFRTGARTDRPR